MTVLDQACRNVLLKMISRLVILLACIVCASLGGTEKIPEGFVMQVMEPTGGKILRPKDWFYYEGHRKGAWMWTITKEDTKGGKEKYETGVRIQVFADVSEQTDESAEVFINQFLAQTRKAAKVVHKHCEPETLGFFERNLSRSHKGRLPHSLFSFLEQRYRYCGGEHCGCKGRRLGGQFQNF